MHEGYIKILIPQSKTDVYREGNYVFIKRLANQCCPVSVLERYIQAAEIDPGSILHLFRPIRWFKSIKGYISSVDLNYHIHDAVKFFNSVWIVSDTIPLYMVYIV